MLEFDHTSAAGGFAHDMHAKCGCGRKLNSTSTCECFQVVGIALIVSCSASMRDSMNSTPLRDRCTLDSWW
jgi:hypothetical protein